jgi:hypothetical protein
MIRYFNSLDEANVFAEQLKIDEPEYADYVQVSETFDESFGIWAREDLGNYVVTNETE